VTFSFGTMISSNKIGQAALLGLLADRFRDLFSKFE